MLAHNCMRMRVCEREKETRGEAEKVCARIQREGRDM